MIERVKIGPWWYKIERRKIDPPHELGHAIAKEYAVREAARDEEALADVLGNALFSFILDNPKVVGAVAGCLAEQGQIKDTLDWIRLELLQLRDQAENLAEEIDKILKDLGGEESE